jgi:hypothetical protein
MKTDAVIGCDAVDAGPQWLRLTTAGGAVRMVPWDGVKLAGMVEAHIKIHGLTEKVAPLLRTHDSLWVAYAEGGLAQVMIEKENPKRTAILEMFAAQLGERWKGDRLSDQDVIGVLMPTQVAMPRLVMALMIAVGLAFFLALAVLFLVRSR